MPISYKGVLPQMAAQLPKGDFLVHKISHPTEELFSIELFISPYNVPLVIELDNEYLILSINVVSDQQNTNQIDSKEN